MILTIKGKRIEKFLIKINRFTKKTNSVNEMLLDEKIAVITGSTGGIGKGIAVSLAQSGATVIITSRSQDKADKTVQELINNGYKASPCLFDLEQPDDIKQLAETVVEEHGKIDILVNNALSRSAMPLLPIHNVEYSHLVSCINANLTNVIALTTSAYPHLKKTKGNVLNIGSVIVNRHIIGLSLYNIFKGALTHMTKSFASEWASDGVRVNQINPGFVMTDTLPSQIPPGALEPFVEYFKQFHPTGKVGDPLDVGKLASYMVSGDASWMSGSIVDIDGAYSVQGLPPLSP